MAGWLMLGTQAPAIGARAAAGLRLIDVTDLRRSGLRALHRSVRPKVPPRNAGIRRCRVRCRWRRFRRSVAAERHGMARTGPTSSRHRAAVPEQGGRHVRRHHHRFGSRGAGVRHGRGGGGLRQRRTRGSDHHRRRAEPPLQECRRRQVRRRHRTGWTGRTDRVQHVRAVVRLRPRRLPRPPDLQLREMDA